LRIKLFYIHPNNYGNLMMASAFIQNYRNECIEKYNEDPEFYMDVLDDDELFRVQQSLEGAVKVYREKLFNRKRRGIIGKLSKIFFMPKEIMYNKKSYDACIVLGGDCISQYYSKQIFITDMYRFLKISKKKPVYLLGQTMGPFAGYAITVVKHCLSFCKIYVRDHNCFQYMQSLFDFKQLYEARDLAFLDIPYQNKPEIVMKVLNVYVGLNPYITIVPSGANRQYTTNIDDYIGEYVRIINYILTETDYNVLLLAHVIHVSDSNDKIIINKILEKLPDFCKERIHIVDHLILPYEARILIGNGQLTITGRMHAAVSAINMGVLPICLSYSVKFKGVIGDDFELNNYILQCRGDKFWKNNYVSSSIINMINLALNDNPKKEKILSLKRIIQQRSLSQIQNVIEELHGGIEKEKRLN